MLKTWKQNLKGLSKEQYLLLREMCHLSKSVYNESVYNIRQHYLQDGSYLRYESNYHQEKTSPNYRRLGVEAGVQAMRDADKAFKSFFQLCKKVKSGKYESWKARLPGYLPKDNLHTVKWSRYVFYKSDEYFSIPMSSWLKEKFPGVKLRIKYPSYLKDKKIREVRIVPKCRGLYFEAQYVFDDEDVEPAKLDFAKSLAIDLGVNNFATCVSSEGDSFIVDGRKLKSQNQWYNKELARLSAIKDHQKIKGYTKLQYRKVTKRNNQVQDFIYKSSRYILNYCLKNQIGNVVVGYNDGFEQRVNLGKVNNQNFVMLPMGRFKDRLEELCKQYGINFVLQEESYTSRASYFDDDEIPRWNPDNPAEGHFSGKRIYRGLYKTSSGQLINADVNGALNILRKSGLELQKVALQSNTPTKIQVA